MNIEQLQEQMNAIVSTAETENRALTDDEVTQYEALEADLDKARKSEEISKRNRAYNAPNIIRTPGTAAKGDEVLERAFDSYLRTGQQNADLVELRAQSAGSDSAGGYTVPAGFRNKLTERRKAFGGIQSVAENISTDSGNAIEWPTIDDTANTAEIVAENGSAASAGADFVFGTKTLAAYKYTSTGTGNAPLKVSVELLQDSAFDVSGFVARKLGERIARKQAADYATGTGSSAPLGLMTTTGDVANNTITYAKLLDVVHTVDPEYRTNAKWVMNDTTLKSVRGVLDGSNRPLLQDSASAGMESMPGGNLQLLGYAVIIDQACAVVASGVNYMAFGDIQEAYVIRNVKDVTVVVNPYTSASAGQVEYSAWARSDATIQNRNAYATLKGN